MSGGSPTRAARAGRAARGCNARRASPVLLAVVLLGCAEPSGTAEQNVLDGTWRYEGVQETPHALLEGTVTWRAAGRAGTTAEGTFALLERSDARVRTLTGVSAARLAQQDIVEFTFVSEVLERRHLGSLRGDSITGQWVDPGGLVVRGSFTLRRQRAHFP
jgi:hypothetical protein